MSEGGRINRLIASLAKCQAEPVFLSGCCRPSKIGTRITPAESSRIASLDAQINGTLLNGGGVTQDRAREILANPQNPGSEGVRIALLEQVTPTPPGYGPQIVINSPPIIPPPPAPPLRECIPKNMRLGS